MKNHLPSTTSLYTKANNKIRNNSRKATATGCSMSPSNANLLVPDLGSGIQTPWIFSLLREFSADSDGDYESESHSEDGDGDVIMMD